MAPGDVFTVLWQGGGGYGDPILRDVTEVADDLEGELLTPEQALRLYGVVANDEGVVDAEATEASRRAVRSERLGGIPAGDLLDDLPGEPLGPALRLVPGADGLEVWSAGGALLSRGHTRWREGALAGRVDPSAHLITLHADLAMTAFYCPLSGVQLAIDVHRVEDEPLHDLDLQETPS